MKKVLYFFGEGCGPCKVLRPKVEEDCIKKGVLFEPIDAEGEDERIQKYNVRNVPTIVILKEGEILAKGVGLEGWDLIKTEL